MSTASPLATPVCVTVIFWNAVVRLTAVDEVSLTIAPFTTLRSRTTIRIGFPTDAVTAAFT